jgi:hypothetical protein
VFCFPILTETHQPQGILEPEDYHQHNENNNFYNNNTEERDFPSLTTALNIIIMNVIQA